MCSQPRAGTRDPIAGGRAVPAWVWLADAVALVLLGVAVGVFVTGGWRTRLGGLTLSLRSGWRLLAWAAILVIGRHALFRRPTLPSRLLAAAGVLSRVFVRVGNPLAKGARTTAHTVAAASVECLRAPLVEAATLRGGLLEAGRIALDSRVAILLAVLLVVGRSLVFTLWEQAAFNSDHAIVGLMAKHLAEGRAFPLFFYGQSYMLGVEAWLAAPLFLLAGPSLPALQLPLLALNVIAAALLLVLLRKELRLSAAAALGASLVFVLAPPATALGLVEANGGSVEPLLYVLLLWVFRRRPALFGLTLGFGFVHREFTAYGLVALLFLRATHPRRLDRATARHVLTALAWVGLSWATVVLLRQWSSPLGPGTHAVGLAFSETNLAELARRFCWSASALPSRVIELCGGHLPVLFGTAPRSLRSVGIASRTTWQGMPGATVVMGVALAVAVARVGVGRWRGSRGAGFTFGWYLVLVGIVSMAAYGSVSCGTISPDTLRYDLLGVLLAVGIAALFFAIERQPAWKAAGALVLVAWTALSAWSHANLIAEYASSPPPDDVRAAVERLLSDGVRRARGSYWLAYRMTFLSEERLVVSSTGPVRITEYEQIAGDAGTWVRESPCEGGRQLAGTVYRCPRSGAR